MFRRNDEMYDQHNRINTFDNLNKYVYHTLDQIKFWIELRLVLGRPENEKISWFLAEYQEYQNNHSRLVIDEIVYFDYELLGKIKANISEQLDLSVKNNSLECQVSDDKQGWTYVIWCDHLGNTIIPTSQHLTWINKDRIINLK